MPDHLHAITDSTRSSGDTLRFINGIVSHHQESFSSSMPRLSDVPLKQRERLGRRTVRKGSAFPAFPFIFEAAPQLEA
jgi:hypothetical protein